MPIAYVKTADAAAWDALYRAHLAEQRDGAWVPRAGVQIDVLGVVYHQTGTTVVDGLTVPVMTARPGWHVNLIAGDVPEVLAPFMVNPVRPQRVFYGAQVLGMPEPLPEAGGTALVQRGVGQQVTDDVIARIERAVLQGRLTTEQAADRIARIEANLAVLDARDARAARLAERDAAVAELQAADAARLALVADRDAQQAIRADAVAKLQTLIGAAARAPEVERRDAARDEIARLTPLIQSAADARPALVAARDAAAAALQAAGDAITAARAARDAPSGKTS